MDNDVKSSQIMFDKEKLQGREKIVINVSSEQFSENPLKFFSSNFSLIQQARNKNNAEIEYLKKYKKGIANILEKVRKDNSKINNVSVCNFAHEIVEFKKGFTVGKPIKYVNESEENNENMKYFLRYLKKVNKKSKDLDKYENLYTFGIAHTFIKFNPLAIDLELDSPFIYEVLDSTKTCCVYSTEIGNPKLFSMVESSITNYNDDGTKNHFNVYTIYYGKKSIILKRQDGMFSIYREEKNEPNFDPITEYSLNQARMGVFEPVISSLNTLNVVRSNQLDDIEQFINAYLVFLNQDPAFIIKNIDEFRNKRVFALKTNNEKTPADVKTLQISLEHSDINQIFNDTKQDVFNQVGVPMATSNTGQGVSGEAQTYGGGWENAQAISNIETTYCSQFEREDLEKFVYCSNEIVGSVVKGLIDVEIDIKYTINKSNNILTKMQAFKYWIDLGGTWERGLEITDLSDDSHTVAVECVENKKQEEKHQIDLEVERTKRIEALKTSNEQDISGSEN